MTHVPAGDPVQLFPGMWITPWSTDDDFAACRNCPGYVGGTERERDRSG